MRYGTKDVLRGIDLTIRRGEVVALLGPNGAGKTTTVEILEGFRRRSSGDVRVLGADPNAPDESWRSRIGVVLQTWGDHPRWQVAELLEHMAGFYPNPRDVPTLLEELGLEREAGQIIQKLSGGQRRRFDVALGIVGNPELLFVDEPTTGFDPEARRNFHDLVERLRGDGLTMLLTTHDLHEAERLADRIVILIDGQIAAEGTTADLAEQARAETKVIWSEDGEEQVQYARDPSEVVWQLHKKFDGPIPDLQVHRPTLEDVYLQMVRAGEPQ
ncbi:ATP-binding cassette domain-containing protein [Nonomuraea phyllanthi]|uniref:ATP-binding cassette domain-containing protein n=2 Tax=Nonomuraea phyllanthi TaxID=2219224 RepID=A0A5C4WX56_9ACTN|nr:ATP-binding cassette domain-containing protein [Nonomuraea phyllanthi]QFY14086.1 ATP-binding cassette domain-containing protein [Nonomuraea phyllanthi]